MIEVYPPHPTGQAAPHSAAVWLDLTNPTQDEDRLVEQFTGTDIPTRADLAHIEQSSRLAFEDGVLRLSAPVITEADTDHPGLGYLGLILTRTCLISVHDEPLKMVQSVRQSTAAATETLAGPTIFTALLEAYVAVQADLLQEARARLDAISHAVFRNKDGGRRQAARLNAQMRERLQLLGRLGERTSLIRESLAAVERMIPFALESGKHWFDPELVARLKAVRDDISSLDMFDDHLLGKVQFLLDAALGLIGIDQNDIFKVLTIASVVGIFPTLVAGWYGMNFANMPEYHWAFGYQFGIGVILASTILPLLWFKWRGWL
jgi:magnesium transporter